MAAHRATATFLLLAVLLAAGCQPSAPPSGPTGPTKTPGAKGSGSKTGSKSTTPTPKPTSTPDTPVASEFKFNPAGQLHANSGQGDADPTIYAPGMRFPIEKPRAFANSQVWGHGGLHGPGGECDAENYGYPWSDNFCETRDFTAPLCPAGTGHQGQDIRPNSCARDKYIAVAAEAGTITHIGTFTVYLNADSGRVFRYLHLDMHNLKVGLGDKVARGQAIGYVANDFGTTQTTIHLHFEIRETVTDGTATITTFVPPYTSLVDAYQRMLAGEK